MSEHPLGIEVKAQRRDKLSPREVFELFANKPVQRAFIVAVMEDGEAEVSMVRGGPDLVTIAAEMLMRMSPGGPNAPPEKPAASRAERRRLNRGNRR